LITKYASSKQAHVRRPKKLEAERRHGQNTKEHALYGLIHYFSVRVQEKRSGLFCSFFLLPAKKRSVKGTMVEIHGSENKSNDHESISERSTPT